LSLVERVGEKVIQEAAGEQVDFAQQSLQLAAEAL
jgi:hypothetical protein